MKEVYIKRIVLSRYASDRPLTGKIEFCRDEVAEVSLVITPELAEKVLDAVAAALSDAADELSNLIRQSFTVEGESHE